MKSILLLSGGLDSTVSLSRAVKETDVEIALTFDYGQRAANKEIEASGKICKEYGIRHRVVELPWLAEVTSTALVNKEVEIPL
ncbi:7-cyano-7-deazaguanine synthase, partial [bacterium]|nr:7-cyano-7-deazaguanine synthase [bacterium]